MKKIRLFLTSILILTLPILSSCNKFHEHTYVNGSCEMCGATEGLRYKLIDGGYEVYAGEADEQMNIVIPSYYNKLPVISIGYMAFYHCSAVIINIPKSVTIIDDYAFKGCMSLEHVIIQEGITSIGDYAFHYCLSLRSITIPDSVTSIDSKAFSVCPSLEFVRIGKRVTSIGDSAFYGCSSLTEVTYNGSKEQWNNISIGSRNNELTSANITFLKKK